MFNGHFISNKSSHILYLYHTQETAALALQREENNFELLDKGNGKHIWDISRTKKCVIINREF